MAVILKNYRIYGQKRFFENVINDRLIGRRGMDGTVESLCPIYLAV